MKIWLFCVLVFLGIGPVMSCEVRVVTLFDLLRQDTSLAMVDVSVEEKTKYATTEICSPIILETIHGDTPFNIDTESLFSHPGQGTAQNVLSLFRATNRDDGEKEYVSYFQTSNPQEIEHMRSLTSLGFMNQPDEKQARQLGIWLAEALNMPGLYQLVKYDFIYLLEYQKANKWPVDPLVHELAEAVLLEKVWDPVLLEITQLLETDSYCVRNKARDEIWKFREVIRTKSIREAPVDTGEGLFEYLDYGLKITNLEWLLEEYEEEFGDYNFDEMGPIFDDFLSEVIMTLDAEAACYQK